ncbi:hypothetical protein, partial [Paenibacillus odorifer]|uniref:hypothetical protein n=1 Tax=Paenibacillus odorifer TaxID=189426 RepID=UPI001C4BE9FA
MLCVTVLLKLPKPPITPARQSYADSDDVICRYIAFWGHFRTPWTSVKKVDSHATDILVNCSAKRT